MGPSSLTSPLKINTITKTLAEDFQMSEKGLVDIKLLNKEFAVLCPEDQKAALFAAAAHLDKKMREIRNSSKAIGLERISIIAALNLTHELLALRSQQAAPRVTIESTPLNQRVTAFDKINN
jgi:cell division protein ZapA